MKLPKLPKLGKITGTHVIYGVLTILIIFYILDYTEVFRVSEYIGTATIIPPPEIEPKPIIEPKPDPPDRPSTRPAPNRPPITLPKPNPPKPAPQPDPPSPPSFPSIPSVVTTGPPPPPVPDESCKYFDCGECMVPRANKDSIAGKGNIFKCCTPKMCSDSIKTTVIYKGKPRITSACPNGYKTRKSLLKLNYPGTTPAYCCVNPIMFMMNPKGALAFEHKCNLDLGAWRSHGGDLESLVKS